MSICLKKIQRDCFMSSPVKISRLASARCRVVYRVLHDATLIPNNLVLNLEEVSQL